MKNIIFPIDTSSCFVILYFQSGQSQSRQPGIYQIIRCGTVVGHPLIQILRIYRTRIIKRTPGRLWYSCTINRLKHIRTPFDKSIFIIRFHPVRCSSYTDTSIKVDNRFFGASFLGCNSYHSIGGSRTINRSRACIFHNIQLLNIIRVYI